MTFQALSDTVLVQLADEPPASLEGPRPGTQRGIALAVGPGHRAEGTTAGRVSVRRGDTVYFSERAGVVFREGAPGQILLSERDVLAVERPEKDDEVPLYVPPVRRPSGGGA